MERYHVSVAAEAYAAAAFARAGYEVSVQYGANQPGYDLVVVKGGRVLKVSVKGSSDGGWVVHAPYKETEVTYREALDGWHRDQPIEVVFFYVQFYNVPFGSMPRCYVARASEVYKHMLTTRGGHISGSLYESYDYKKGVAKGTSEKIPAAWALTEGRLATV